MNMKFSRIARVALAALTLGGLSSLGSAAPFGVGNGTVDLLSDTSAPLFLDEYTQAGALVQTISLPTAPTGSLANGLSLQGAETAVGGLNLSTNGQYLVFGAYDLPVGTANVRDTAPATNKRVIVRVDSDGVVDTSTQITNAFSRFAGVATDDGLRFWATGNNRGSVPGGLFFVGSFGGSLAATQLVGTGDGLSGSLPSPSNLLMPGIFSGQLFTAVSFNTGAVEQRGVSQIVDFGTTTPSGLPTTGPKEIALTAGFTSNTPSHNPKAFFFADSATAYLTDSGVAANGGGLQKWTFSGSAWSQATAPFPLPSGTDATNAGLGGVTGTASGSNITLFATSTHATGTAAGNCLVRYVSTDGGATFAPTVMVTSPNGVVALGESYFRGVALAPVPPSTGVSEWQLFE